MLSTFCLSTIWAIYLEFCGKPSILEADDFLGACCRNAMTPKKLWTLLFPQWGFEFGGQNSSNESGVPKIGIIERGVPQAYVRARASSAMLCSVHVLRVFLCISISKKGI